jgi:hypothetical protein
VLKCKNHTNRISTTTHFGSHAMFFRTVAQDKRLQNASLRVLLFVHRIQLFQFTARRGVKGNHFIHIDNESQTRFDRYRHTYIHTTRTCCHRSPRRRRCARRNRAKTGVNQRAIERIIAYNKHNERTTIRARNRITTRKRPTTRVPIVVVVVVIASS